MLRGRPWNRAWEWRSPWIWTWPRTGSGRTTSGSCATTFRSERTRWAGFRGPAVIEAGMQEVLSGRLKLAETFPLMLFPGKNSPATRKLPFEFVKKHLDQIMQGNPSVFGNSFGSFLPNVGGRFCDAESKQ